MAAGYAWFLVLCSVFLCNLMKSLLPSISSFMFFYTKRVWLFLERCLYTLEKLCSLAQIQPGHYSRLLLEQGFNCTDITKLSKMVQKDAEQENEMRVEIQDLKREQFSISMMDEFARYARLERKINKLTDQLKAHVKSRTAQQAKMKWVVNIVFYILQAALMISLIWKYYSDPVTVVPNRWIAPVERLVAFPTGVAGGVGITCWLVVCNKVVTLGLNAVN